jgi:hypothetical protein
MDEHHQHGNSEQGSARVREFDMPSDARGGDGKEPRQDRDQARVNTFEANAEIAADRYVYAGPRQVAQFYGMRVRKNIEFGRRFAEVEGIADLIGLQHEYVRDMLLDYSSSFWSFYEMAGFDLRGLQQTAKRLYR